jgi:signal recognition particle subunit SRP54
MEALDVFILNVWRQDFRMGDIVSLVKRRKSNSTSRKYRLQKKLAKDQFNFNDFLAQINQVKKWKSERLGRDDPRNG